MPQLKELNKPYHLLLAPSFYSLQIEGSPISTVVIIPEKKKKKKKIQKMINIVNVQKLKKNKTTLCA